MRAAEDRGSNRPKSPTTESGHSVPALHQHLGYMLATAATVTQPQRGSGNPQLVTIPEKGLPRQCRRIEGARQTPLHKAFAKPAEAGAQRRIGRNPLKSVAPEYALDLRC